jgi:CHASE2 domain-containing sensor protein
MNSTWLLAALASFAVGCAVPWLNGLVVTGFARRAAPEGRPGMAAALTAMVVSLGLGSVALILFGRLWPGSAPAIVLAFMLGIGLVRWRRKEL